jgi:hypothetical protein
MFKTITIVSSYSNQHNQHTCERAEGEGGRKEGQWLDFESRPDTNGRSLLRVEGR